MVEYTYKDIIIDPNDPRLEGAIGKECYFADYPKLLLEDARSNSSIICSYRLREICKNAKYPFVDKDRHTWTLIIIKKEPCYEDQVKQWIEENNLKVGDYVKVTRRAENHADGLDDYWYDLMRDSVGKILKVKEISNFIMLDNGINYPYFVLEKTEPPKPKYVPFESKEEFIDAFHYHDNTKYSETDDILLNYGMWLKLNELYVLVTCISDEYIKTFESCYFWNELLENFEFLDGTPCGKESKDV